MFVGLWFVSVIKVCSAGAFFDEVDPLTGSKISKFKFKSTVTTVNLDFEHIVGTAKMSAVFQTHLAFNNL